jgi:hypothetical protein
MAVEDDREMNYAVKRRSHFCCSYSEIGIMTSLKSIARIQVTETENPRVTQCSVKCVDQK